MNTILNQSKAVKTFSKDVIEDGEKVTKYVKIQYDDTCKNGHNTFSMTCDTYKYTPSYCKYDRYFLSGGCDHDSIIKYFPKLKKYVKWHLVSTDSPLHYIANTVYHASDKDCYGLRKGEKRQLKNGKTGQLVWKVVVVDKKGKEFNTSSWIDSNTKPCIEVKAIVKPVYKIGEGKKSELENARACAVWANATLEQLQDKELLKARLPQLMKKFKKDVEKLGFTY